MAKDFSDVVEKIPVDKLPVENRSEESAGEVVLRDESDEIIDTLKNQLRSLQGKLDAYKQAEKEGGEPPGPTGDDAKGEEEILNAWNAGLAPHLASKLQIPAEELTGRLNRLIEQADDPEMKQELERCRELAYFLFDTFRKISSSHRLLTESLTAPEDIVDTEDFCRSLENILPSLGTSLPVEKQPDLPQSIKFASRSAETVMKALGELAVTIFGHDLTINVGHLPPGGAGQDEPPFLELRIFSKNSWQEAEHGEEVSSFVMRRGITANTVVDMLYVEKIIELQGGTFTFHRQKGKVFGFVVQLPFEPV